MKSKNATSHSVKKKQIKLTSFCSSVRINCFQICVLWKIVRDLSLATFYLLFPILQVCVIFSKAESFLARAALAFAHVKTIPYTSSSTPVLLHVFQSQAQLNTLLLHPVSSSFINMLNGKPSDSKCQKEDSQLPLSTVKAGYFYINFIFCQVTIHLQEDLSTYFIKLNFFKSCL